MSDEEKSESKGPHLVNIALRIVAMALSVAAAALMAMASQCTIYQYGVPLHTVTYKDFGPFVYLVVANAVAAGLEATAIFLSIWKKGPHAKCKVLLPLLDAIVLALLYSSAGAAFAAGDITYCGPYGRRVSVCAGSAGSFCSQVHLSTYIALAAAGAVSAAAVAMHLSVGGSKSESESDSESETCGHGCHHKH